ncbi:winged helix-turn-helix transcriptional regulator [Methylopila turkensis]|uniref:Transcriptional regulator n=1 Tax=Methylopila turkensis TaxID=1437816 RepID=A0A9W6JN02_9HYPH|nr:helix-turn-helix domain-containing protein [Methylopila turkensis]GLK80625.1 transcriptional regulator [Methylopila turkensis]
MARVRHDRLDCSPGCAVEATLQFIDGKWKGVILYHLLSSTLRFNEIRRRLPSVTPRMLTTQLRELESDGFVARKVFPEVPPKVEYSLTERGRSLEPVVMALKAWGDAHAGVAAKAA